jgi:heterodisulfide reductase subunit C
MRQLIGKIAVKARIVEEVYLSEQVRCHECQKTVPIGVEVVTVVKGIRPKKILKRAFYCRSHAGEYEARARGEG